MSRYATGTSVSVDRSKAEIERTLARYGADDIVSGQSRQSRQAFVQFAYRRLHVEVRITLPDPDDKAFRKSPTGKRSRDERQAFAAWEKACRQQWRVLLLLLKAQLEAVENGVYEPWEAFLPWLMLPTGKTVRGAIAPRLDELLDGTVPPKLLMFTEAP